ncbi:MAG: hypothetical protein ABUL60_00945 [Myxococcales bacterium]
MTEPSQANTQHDSSPNPAEQELQWQDAHAQRQRAAELFHADDSDYLSDDDLDE